jgi:hypothetical protein
MYNNEDLRPFCANALRDMGMQMPGVPTRDALVQAIAKKMCESPGLQKSHVLEFIDSWLNTNSRFPAICDIHAWMKTLGLSGVRSVCSRGVCKGDGYVFDDKFAYSCTCIEGDNLYNRHKIGRFKKQTTKEIGNG